MTDTPLEMDAQKRGSDYFPCPSCGANMYFDPDNANLKCQFCDHVLVFERENGAIQEYDLSELPEENQNWAEGALAIQCENCGAKSAVGSETMTKFCAYCGSSHIVNINEFTGIAPESLVPFTVSEKKARESFQDWIRKRWLAPNALKKKNEAGRINGAYVPYWTYDADTYYSYTAMAGEHYYVTETRMENGERKEVRVQKTRWYPVAGSGRQYFDDLQVSATNKLTKGLVDSLEPFALEKLVPYQPEYLSGFQAERYSVDVKAGWEEAKAEINAHLHSLVRSSIHADEVRDINIFATYKDVAYKHFLVPVWLSSYLFKKKTYQVMINGENGKVVGKFPVSFWKVLLLILGILGFIALIVFIVMQFQ